MSRLVFFSNAWASGEIRARQVASRLGAYAVVDPDTVYSDDVCIFVKGYPHDEILSGVSKVYVDVVDSYATIPWLRSHPSAGAIAISHKGGEYLSNALNKHVPVIVEHHCNFERMRKVLVEPKVVGYVGELELFHIDVDTVKYQLSTIGMEFVYLDKFKCRKDVCDFYHKIDVQLTFRRDTDGYGKTTGMLKNPLKLANAGSFGIPTVCYPEVTYVDEWDGYFMPAHNVDAILYWLDMLKQKPDMYADMSDKVFTHAEKYHIDNVAPMYLRLLDNKEHVMHDYSMNQIVNLDSAVSCSYPFEERIARRGNDHLDVDESMANLVDVADVVDKHGLKMWLMFGTLLGAVRDNALIARDRDVDLGVFWSDFNLLSDVLIDLKGIGFDLIRTGIDDGCITIMRNDEYIDFFLFRSQGGKYVCQQPGLDAKIDMIHFNNLSHLAFGGNTFLVPSGVEALFESWYGKDWRIPTDYRWAYTDGK